MNTEQLEVQDESEKSKYLSDLEIYRKILFANGSSTAITLMAFTGFVVTAIQLSWIPLGKMDGITLVFALVATFIAITSKYFDYLKYKEEQQLFVEYNKTMGSILGRENVDWVLSGVEHYLIDASMEMKKIFLKISEDDFESIHRSEDSLRALYQYFDEKATDYRVTKDTVATMDLFFILLSSWYLNKLKLVIGLKRLGFDIFATDKESPIWTILHDLNSYGNVEASILNNEEGLAFRILLMKHEDIDETTNTIEGLFLKILTEMLNNEKYQTQIYESLRDKVSGFVESLNRSIASKSQSARLSQEVSTDYDEDIRANETRRS